MIKKLSEAMDYEERMDIALEIARNNESELTAIEGYQELLKLVEGDLEAVDVISEIISDEKNHIEKLNKLMEKYDKIAPNVD